MLTLYSFCVIVKSDSFNFERFVLGDLSDLQINRMPVHEQVFSSLKNAISEGKWKVGEKIPTEVELAKAFGVNRLTVRLALQRLGGIGVLESRVGDGTYVKAFDFGDYVDKTKEFYLNEDVLDKVSEFREAIEVNALRLAMNRASEAEIEELDAICHEMENARAEYIKNQDKADLDKFLNADIAFHGKICQIAHNDLFVYAYDVARPALYEYMKRLINTRSDSWIRKASSGDPDKHRRVCNALKERDLEKCMEEYEDIIDYKVEY